MIDKESLPHYQCGLLQHNPGNTVLVSALGIASDESLAGQHLEHQGFAHLRNSNIGA
jgi:hypothetical protein